MKVCISARHKRDHVIGEVKCKVCLIRFTKQSLAVHAKEAHSKLTTNEVYGNVTEKRNRDEEVSITRSWHKYFLFHIPLCFSRTIGRKTGSQLKMWRNLEEEKNIDMNVEFVENSSNATVTLVCTIKRV